MRFLEFYIVDIFLLVFMNQGVTYLLNSGTKRTTLLLVNFHDILKAYNPSYPQGCLSDEA